MPLTKSRILVLGVTVFLSGCSFANDALFPSLESNHSSGTVVTRGDDVAEPVPLVSDADLSDGVSGGTFVGQKVQTFRGELGQLQSAVRRRGEELQQLRAAIVSDSKAYHETVASISARLQVGSTPGNPVLQRQWSGAQKQLDGISASITAMNRLASHVSSDSAMGAYLIDSINAAYGLSGAVEDDHRQLRMLQDQTNQTMVLFERLLSDLSQDISRQQSYLASERSNLNTLALGVKSGQLYGAALGSRASSRANAMALSSAFSMPADKAKRRPLVVIRFDRPNVEYQQPLYQAVSQALERKPTAVFDIIAVSPADGNPGQAAVAATSIRRNAEQVIRTLSDMGLGSDRTRLTTSASNDVSGGEVQVFVR
ncbi:hypothetical protein HEQ63_10590 [Haematospirillum jordaniae]|uniref:hypothetical protein n=1 Tax=Haematospirillum jordaniae TaxID=1549855 RepID=UPI001432E423|nr:hypothetical protein [Haematospirillum jordaniae]NKD86626.1 hypothetical protein [Haematospirillum jordaniae]